ncbi:copine-3-like isoform X1 [Stylophora pistillata]|uniref:Copine-3 n=1 Tax=Stylophora pistillata TaxID=50429 RepID=A0A2B4RKZ8_STYPI|nr:copine-3-like isoform X1 [Stylophora pistillata]PFX18281.1 Copine-3 [Stylophora pistillata]
MAAECVTRVELHISCRGLLDKDTTSKSDPLCAMYIQDSHGKWVEHARTEKVQNNLNPDFAQGIVLDYYFEMVQKLKFAVYDVDNATSSLGDDDFLGDMECNLGQVVSKKSFASALQIKGRKVGAITVYAEELKGGNEVVQLTFRATNLDKKDFLGKSDPFLQLSKLKSDGETLLVHRTEVIKNNLNPSWKSFDISLSTLCGGDYDAPIRIGCYDWDEDDTNDLIGCVDITLRSLIDSKESGKGLDLVNAKKKQKKKGYVNSGVLYVAQCNITKIHTFLDFVMGGCQINFTVGIDFTASNGDPRLAQSLHYLNPHEPNEYVKALIAVGEVCQDYDTDKFFPALGFGAKIPPGMQVSHEFPLNFNPTNPYCHGIQEIVLAYQNCIRQVQLYGPTNVAPIINHVIRFAEQAGQENTASQYYVLLLLTDGVLSDMEDTKAAIVKASRLPMSVIIVGVGQADFKDMDELDADEGRLRSGRHYAERDIVQFVPFREFKSQSPAVLAKHVLAEIPKQVQEYFNKRGLAPMQSKGPQPPYLGGL